ncbi:hypothetical protein [Chroococcidiopsis sp. CCALA 051]|uniref:hypothetical protein n=1 Tax=Chroococcidiopsis sp. CCALA 051 TaxID=869949 RepID=UPI001E3C601E|nr:hypothetical protein [Chroococcidiopsis sp. CCALA 051]
MRVSSRTEVKLAIVEGDAIALVLESSTAASAIVRKSVLNIAQPGILESDRHFAKIPLLFEIFKGYLSLL